MLAFVLLVLVDVVTFWLPVYEPFVAPDSTTGFFERTLHAADLASQHPATDVLVLGDSRLFQGLSSYVADKTGHGLTFINAAISGSTPRVWASFVRKLDPAADRYRAVVIPVDTYADDDGSVGSVDNDNHYADLHYLAFETEPWDIVPLANSFGTVDEKLEALLDLSLRGPLLREDVQSLVSDPAARIAALRARPLNLMTINAVRDSLGGMRADFATQTLTLPHAVGGEELERLRRQIFHVPARNEAYARYRREWLGPIVRRYRAKGVPVIFVRIPARPLGAATPAPPSGSVVEFQHADGARLVPQDGYTALERPRFFRDAEHLNIYGAAFFSVMFGRDVAAAVRESETGAPPSAQIAREPVVTAAAHSARAAAAIPTPEPFATAKPQAQLAPVTVSVATPLPEKPATLSIFGPQVQAIAAAARLGEPIPLLSYEFAIFFAAVVVLVLLLPNEPSRRALMLFASWYFYARWNAAYLAVLLALTTIDYCVARGLEARPAHKRTLLAAGVCANLAFLAFAKYADFFSGTVAQLAGRPAGTWALHLLVPVGISFHTFQSISYIVDVSRGKVRAQRSYLDYALYIAFFPQLLAGPIVRAGRFFGELYARRRPSLEHVARGVSEIALGVLKKCAIADRFAPIADSYYGAIGAHPGAPAAWSAALAFAVQIYFDFSGYTDIAIGLARILGFDFPQNFHRPYLAWSVTEFWRRWHMTLSSWLRDYLYIPLGGNRGGRFATYRNLIVTMLLGGLWHGAGWTFVIWGGYHGVLLAAERALGIGRSREADAPRGLRRVCATLATFALVCAGWIFFRAQSLGDAFAVLHACAAGGAGPLLLDGGDFAIVAIAAAVEIGLEMRLFSARSRIAVALATFLAIQLGSYPGTSAQFVYFKF